MDAKKKAHSDVARWVVLHPIFIDEKRSKQQGRRIPKAAAVSAPSAQEMLEILQHVGLNVQAKRGMHPRDPNREPPLQAFIKVQLKNDDGKPVDTRFPTRDSLLLHCAEMIPKLKSRQAGASAAPPASSGGGGGGGSGGGGNKKKKGGKK